MLLGLGQGDVIVLLDSFFTINNSLRVDVGVFGSLGLGEEQIGEHLVRISLLGGLMTCVLPIRSWVDCRESLVGNRRLGYGFIVTEGVADNLDIVQMYVE